MADQSSIAEAALTVMDAMLDAAVAIDADGVVLVWNRAATQIFGWSRAEAVGRSMSDLIIPPLHRDSHREGMRRHQETGRARIVNRRIEITAIDRSAREFPVELSIIATPGGPAAFVGFLRDISDRRRSQDRLALSEESLRLTTQAAEIGTWDLDLITDTLTWSERTKAMFGISANVVCTIDDFYSGMHPEDKDAISLAFAQALDPDVRSVYDVQYRTVGREDGLVRWVAAKGKGLFSDDGRCVRAVGTAIDITERKLADARDAFMLELSDLLRSAETEVALQSASSLMGRHFGVSRVGYGLLDPAEDVFDYTICWTDGSVSPLLGRFPAHAFGRKIVAKLSVGETVVVDDLFGDTLSDEEETRLTASSVDTRAILVVPFLRAGRLRTIVYLNDRSVRRWSQEEVAFMEEIAERTRQVIERGEAETALLELNATLEARVEARTRELRSAEEALRQSQKMEAIGQLTGGIAHDFNNLLQGITGSLELMARRLESGRANDLDRYVAAALGSAERAAALTHRLLAFSRRQPLEPRAVGGNPLILSMEELLRRTLGEAVELRLRLSDELWFARCDPNQLENAVLNLAINARDAMPDGGALTIETRNVDIVGEQAASSPDLKPGKYVRVSVSDTGVGMDDETIGRAFEPFFTTKPTGQGTGLGLSMIYGFTKQSGGGAKILSEPGKGSRFELYLPEGEDEGQADQSASSAQSMSRGEGVTVLVVEDEPVVRALIVEVLVELGYQVLEAADGPMGLEILQSRRHIDLLVTDIGLPGLNGRQIADAARVKRPMLKILFMTGYAEVAADTSSALEPGMAIVAKPFVMEGLAARIQDLVKTDVIV